MHRPLLAFLMVFVAAALPAQVPTLSPEPILVIPATASDGTVQIGRINDADLLPDGGVVVADGSANTLLFFGADGRLRTRAGGSGAGPGEFRQLWGVVVCGGRVVGYELSTTRLNRFTPAGRFVDALPLEQPLLTITPIACAVDGGLVGLRGLRPTPTDAALPSVLTMKGRLAVIDTTGAARIEIVEESAMQMVSAGGGGVPRPLAPMLAYAALGPDLLLGTGADATIRMLHAGAQSTRALPLPRRAASGADRAVAESRWTEFVPEGGRDRATAALQAVPPIEVLPRYRAMLAGTPTSVWLLTSAPSARTETWTVTDGTRLLGTVTIPGPGGLVAIAGSRALVLATNDDGEQRLEVYGVMP